MISSKPWGASLLRGTALLCAALLTNLAPAQASERASGQFVAAKACDAYSSFSKSRNPGAVRTTPGAAYQIIEVNRAKDWQWIRVEVPGAEPNQRWVARECGNAQVRLDARSAPAGRHAQQGGMCSTYDQHDSYVLAVSWQPGFCEHAGYRGRKPECDALNSGKLAIEHLTLHGLWPNRKECGTRYGNCMGPDGKPRPFQLKEETVARIAPWMPNFHYERGFGKHEWDKHGTCQALGTDEYFDVAVRAVRQLDATEVGKQLRKHIGRPMPVADFFERVRQAHGKDVANNIQLVCTRGKYLQEIRVRLPRQFEVGKDIGKLVGGTGFHARTDGCGGEVYIERGGPD